MIEYLLLTVRLSLPFAILALIAALYKLRLDKQELIKLQKQ